ncbi:hypothetical protein LguiA_019913 [Lonicera macranthoides]
MVRSKKLAILMVLSILGVAMVAAVVATIEQDEKDCADQLTNLAACIPFVSGSASKPTPECCENTKKVKSAKPKCLCVLIKESTDPSIGLPVNTTLALQMPSACNIDASVSDCPSLLNLPLDSADAKIFKGADASTSASSTSNTPPASSGSSTSPSSSTGSSTDSKSTTTSTNTGSNLAGGSSTMIGLVAIGWIFI